MRTRSAGPIGSSVQLLSIEPSGLYLTASSSQLMVTVSPTGPFAPAGTAVTKLKLKASTRASRILRIFFFTFYSFFRF
ncbi:hypothetical protein ES703_40540 [subsurface metagenome]